MRKRTIITAIIGVLASLGIALGFTTSASAGNTPTPTPPTVTPGVVVNPFAGCNFSSTFEFTFDPVSGRFVRAIVPSIVCDVNGRVRVYDLTPTPHRR